MLHCALAEAEKGNIVLYIAIEKKLKKRRREFVDRHSSMVLQKIKFKYINPGDYATLCRFLTQLHLAPFLPGLVILDDVAEICPGRVPGVLALLTTLREYIDSTSHTKNEQDYCGGPQNSCKVMLTCDLPTGLERYPGYTCSNGNMFNILRMVS